MANITLNHNISQTLAADVIVKPVAASVLPTAPVVLDANDAALVIAIETGIRSALTQGTPDGTVQAVMSPTQYTGQADSAAKTANASTVAKFANRATAAGVVSALRARPLRLLVCSVGSLPSPVVGGIIYVSDGAAGTPVLAFSDGTSWLRSDTRAVVG